jgi:hypothetical protein
MGKKLLTALIVIYLHVSLFEQGQMFTVSNEKNFAYISVSINNHKLITHLSLLEQSEASSSTKTNSYLFCLTLDACQSNGHRAYLLNFCQLAELF